MLNPKGLTVKGTIWKHRKGGTYTVIGIAKGCERHGLGIEGRDMVVYQANDAERRLYVRAKHEFLDGRFILVSKDDGRFTLLSKDLAAQDNGVDQGV